MCLVDTDEAERTLELLKELGLSEAEEFRSVGESTDAQGDPERCDTSTSTETNGSPVPSWRGWRNR